MQLSKVDDALTPFEVLHESNLSKSWSTYLSNFPAKSITHYKYVLYMSSPHNLRFAKGNSWLFQHYDLGWL